MNSNSDQTPLAPLLGRYEKLAADGVGHVWEIYYEGGAGENAFFRLRWGRLNAKKLQSRTVDTYEAYSSVHKARRNGFNLVDGAIKNWSDIQKQTLSAALEDVPQQIKKSRKI